MPRANDNNEIIYESILVKIDNTYLGWEPGIVEYGSGMKKIPWGKQLPDDIDTAVNEDGESLYVYDNNNNELVNK